MILDLKKEENQGLSAIIKYLVANATLIIFILFYRLVLIRVHFTYSNFACGFNGGVDVKWSGGLIVEELH
jgi:hypothetical protein